MINWSLWTVVQILIDIFLFRVFPFSSVDATDKTRTGYQFLPLAWHNDTGERQNKQQITTIYNPD